MKLEDMPETVPKEHQAKSSGALGTPHRNIPCYNCQGRPMNCFVCFCAGELTFDGKVPRIRHEQRSN